MMVFSESSYPMNTNMIGFNWFSKNLCVFVFWTKVHLASALDGLKQPGDIQLSWCTTALCPFYDHTGPNQELQRPTYDLFKTNIKLT